MIKKDVLSIVIQNNEHTILITNCNLSFKKKVSLENKKQPLTFLINEIDKRLGYLTPNLHFLMGSFGNEC